jgi:hypothetical protein
VNINYLKDSIVSVHQIHVFISHSWKYTKHYNTLESWIFQEKWSAGQASLEFKDYSVPNSHPITDFKSKGELEERIKAKISRCHLVVIPTGMYASHSEWIQKEIDIAVLYSKPILAINPWGQQRRSSVVAAAATKTVGWNKEPLVSAIWELYRK